MWVGVEHTNTSQRRQGAIRDDGDRFKKNRKQIRADRLRFKYTLVISVLKFSFFFFSARIIARFLLNGQSADETTSRRRRSGVFFVVLCVSAMN